MSLTFRDFYKSFQKKDLEGCMAFMNQDGLDINKLYNWEELNSFGFCGFLLPLQLNKTVSLLHIIARWGEEWAVPLIGIFKEIGGDINLQTDHQHTALMCACNYSKTDSSLKIVETLLDMGADPNIKDILDRTAIYYAEYNITSYPETVYLLKEYKDKVFINPEAEKLAKIAKYARTKYSLSDLYELITDSDLDLDLDAQNRNGWTVLMYAAKYSGSSSLPEAVELLIKAGANVNLQTKKGTALITAAANSNGSSSLNTVKLLIRAGADLELTDEDGNTALIFASRMSNDSSSLETVILLLRAGANVDARDKYGSTALMFAVQLADSISSIETVITLLEAGASIDLLGSGGRSALIFASGSLKKYRSVKAMEILIRNGAKVDIKDKDGKSALDYAGKRGFHVGYQLLIAAGAT